MVIGLPANIFFGTSIPTCVLVLNKHRKADDDILFIDASNHFEKGTNNNVLSEEDLQRILDAVSKRSFIDKYAFTATQADLVENDYNLNISRYVDTFEEEEIVDLSEVVKQLVENDKAIRETDKTITSFCHQLSINTPFEVINE